jgi:hypothetical protein
MSETPPYQDLCYCYHHRGFALAARRKPMLSRYYIQCDLDAQLKDWPDDRFWQEFKARCPPDILYELYGSTEAGWVMMLHPDEQFAKMGHRSRPQRSRAISVLAALSVRRSPVVPAEPYSLRLLVQSRTKLLPDGQPANSSLRNAFGTNRR